MSKESACVQINTVVFTHVQVPNLEKVQIKAEQESMSASHFCVIKELVQQTLSNITKCQGEMGKWP